MTVAFKDKTTAEAIAKLLQTRPVSIPYFSLDVLYHNDNKHDPDRVEETILG
jgi:hypothetical protein